jgi:hypothetical protein
MTPLRKTNITSIMEPIEKEICEMLEERIQDSALKNKIREYTDKH